MDWNDPPATAEPAQRGFGGIRRTVATIALAAGLLTVGGVAIVAAASPDPSTSAAPAATSQPSTGGSTAPSTGGTTAPSTRQGHTGTCANKGGGSSTPTTPTTPTPTTAPSTAAPSSNL
jgi:hypothetical protein